MPTRCTSNEDLGLPVRARRFAAAQGCRFACAALLVVAFASAALADRVLLKDGTMIEADEAWDDPQGVWYRQGGVTYLVERARVQSIEREGRAAGAAKEFSAAKREPGAGRSLARLTHVGFVADAGTGADVTAAQFLPSAGDAANKPRGQAGQPVTIYLTDGASFEVDEANEAADGIWYKRGALSIFVDRVRIARVERGSAEEEGATSEKLAVRRERRWTTGGARLDQLIRENGARYGVDPYLIFLVMEQESHFNTRAVSPVGARGLMQLMPGTAARFGVRNAHDPAQSVAGGTRYLKQLLGRFNNRVDLALASYNAGEGNVVKFGYRVPPFRETRSYVRKIGSRYGSLAHARPGGEREPAKKGQPE